MLSFVKPEITKRRTSSSSKIDIAAMKASTDLHGGDIESYERFWQVFEEFSNDDRQLLLKFMSGRTRL